MRRVIGVLNKVELEFDALADGTYATPLDALRQSLTGGGALLLSNPHNPLGKVFPREELQAVADICLEQDAWIISDEIHAELCFDGRVHIPTASLSPEIAKRTITLMSASKAYNIAGLKTSFMIIQDSAFACEGQPRPLRHGRQRQPAGHGSDPRRLQRRRPLAGRVEGVSAKQSRLSGGSRSHPTAGCDHERARKARIWRGSIARRWDWTTRSSSSLNRPRSG